MKYWRIELFYLFLSIIMQASAAIQTKYAALSIFSSGKVLFFLNPWYLSSLFCLFAQAVFWQLVLKKLPLFFSYVMTSLVYVFIMIASIVLFHEDVGSYNIVGSCIILIGVTIINIPYRERN